jgi:hypothetical protein
VGIVDHYEKFYASHDHMPGSEHTLRVTGTVVCRTGGCAAKLQEHEGNAGINPEMLHLDLILTAPQEGSAVTEVLTPVSLDWSIDDPQIDYGQVQFNVVGTDDKPPPVLDVEHPE